MEMKEATSVGCASLDSMQMKICLKCSENVKVHVTCFKCNRIYHPKCLIKAPTAYVNEMGQIFCCQNLTSKHNTFETKFESQENKNERCNEEGLGGSDDGWECSGPEQQEYNKAENTCDTSLKKNTLEEVNGDRDNFVCSFCEVKFFNETSYREHIELCKRNNLRPNKTHGAAVKLKKMFKCDKCNYQAKWAYLLKSHLNIHSHDKRFRCTFKSCKCMQSVDTSQVKHCDCRLCEYRTGNKDNLRHHITRMHRPEEKLYKCNDCSYTARQKMSLREHIFTHLGLKPFGCDTCEYATVAKRSLDQHIALKHSAPPKINVACSFCEMKFVDKRSYKRHLKLCGRNNLRLNTTQDAIINKKLHKCDKCTYTSKWLSRLKDHLISHSSEKPFKCTFINCTCTQSPNTSQVKDCDCSVCDFRTGRKASLSMHMFRHSTKGRYECNDCTYTCHEKTTLRAHILLYHLGTKQFVCDVCGFASGHKSIISRHKKRRHVEIISSR